MRALTILRLRLRTLLRSRRLDRELEEELAFHLDRETERNLAAGLPVPEARAAAARSLGRITHVREGCREERRFQWLTGAASDLRSAFRSLRRAPGFAALVIVMLTLGIGANTAVFSVADALLFRALPVAAPERLFQVLQPDGPGLTGYGELFTSIDFREMRTGAAPFAQLAALGDIKQTPVSIAGGREEPVRRQPVSENYFAAMGVEPSIGDLGEAQPAAAVISYGFWQRRFGADPGVLGKTVRVGATLYQIAGVSQAGFSGAVVGSAVDLWTPLADPPPSRHPAHTLQLIGRLLPGATLEQAAGPLQTYLHGQMLDMVKRAPAGMPKSLIDRILQLRIKVIPAGSGLSPLRGGGAAPLLIVFGLVGMVLLLACATVASLFESRRPLRRAEMAVRASLGASRWRLARQLLWEAAALAGAAAVLGLFLARWLGPVLLTLLAASGARLELTPDLGGRVLCFTALVSILTALAFGLLPAWRSSAAKPSSAMRPAIGHAGDARSRAAKAMVAIQVSVSFVLVLGAAAFVRTLIHLNNADTGFDRRNIIVADVRFQGDARGQQPAAAWQELERQAARIPGVEAASLSSGSPFDGAAGNGMLRLPGKAPSANLGAVFFLASSGFFDAAGIARIVGRDFEPRDFVPGAPPVALIGETLARQAFGGRNAVGQIFSNLEDSPPRWVTVIGVVRDIKFGSLREAAPHAVYYPYTWPRPIAAMSLVLRARRDVDALGPALRRAARLADPALSLGRITTQTKLIDDSLARERLLASVASVFGALSLAMAIVGLYGVASFSVSRRRQEIGVRMALGAGRGNVARMILGESGLVVAAGTAAGLAISTAAQRLVAALLFGVRSYDAATLATTACFLISVTVAAALIPAWRAVRIDPAAALRDE